MHELSYKELADWAVPIILTFGLYHLSKISERIAQLSEAIAVTTTKMVGVEERLERVESNGCRKGSKLLRAKEDDE